VTEDVTVEAWRVHRRIGTDGSVLVKTLSDDADDVRNRLKDGHSRYYQETASMLTLLPCARELLYRIADLGLQMVLATSAPEDELAMLRAVLDCDDVVSAVTSSRDVDTAKPKPEIVHVALGRAGVTADRAAFIGDAVWDAEAAGVPA
jgi:phosphoglycolate phosphatase-like HAD superfamily hydrolase